ncbi:hypothetical protein ABWL39_10410 [Chitinivorax sp. PXF-14]|uniref:hypothetical protein n=1 Tax=Chitinivorax sp. PXF-14 TaxID=3230488 RepID=UPI0034669FC5
MADFIAQATAPKGKLGPWEAEIVALLAAGVSYRQVVVFLASQGVAVSVGAVHEFVHAKKRVSKLAGAKGEPVAPTVKTEAPVANPTTTPAKPGELPKFVWDATRKREIDW